MATRKPYWELLRDPRWQKRRLEVMQAADFTCEECDAKDRTLNVHHKLYRKGADPWDYAQGELQCLCEPCHERVTFQDQRMKEVLAQLSSWDRAVILGYAMGRLQFARFVDNFGPDGATDVPLADVAEVSGFVVGLCAHAPIPRELVEQDLIGRTLPARLVYAIWRRAAEEAGMAMDEFQAITEAN